VIGRTGGYTAAFRAADLGASRLGSRANARGVCLNVGCIVEVYTCHVAKGVTRRDASDVRQTPRALPVHPRARLVPGLHANAALAARSAPSPAPPSQPRLAARTSRARS